MAVADSETNQEEEVHLARDVIDGDLRTWWHSDYLSEPEKPLPHFLDIFFGDEEHWISGIQYWPRQDQENGRIGKFEVYISEDGRSFGKATAAAGEWADTKEAKVWIPLCSPSLLCCHL
jgi:hypothetical protein